MTAGVAIVGGRVVGVCSLHSIVVHFGGWWLRSCWWSESRYLILVPDAA